MRKFSYEARDSASNKIVRSTVQAESENAAAQLLTKQGFVPLNIVLEDEQGGFLARLTNRITSKDKIVFSRQLATLIGAGLPLSQSMRTILDQTQNKRMQEVIQEIIGDIEGGKQLSAAFSKHPQVFNKVFIALIQSGEASGTLDDALRRIAAQQEHDAAITRRIRGALTYPVIVLVVIIAVIVFMLVTVVPQVKNLYNDLHKELPLLTQMFVGAADFLTNYWWIVLAVVVVGGYFLWQYLKTDSGIHLKDKFKLNVPLFKGMFSRLYMSRFARTGQTLLSTGVPMLDMLRITSDAVNNTIIAEEIDRAAEKVKSGKALSSALANEEYFSAMVPQMIKIGEQSGKIDEMMEKTAKIYEDELDEQINTISTAIEPIMMVLLALVAGLIVGAVLFPIYSLVNDINV